MEDPATLRERISQLTTEMATLREKRSDLAEPLDEIQNQRTSLGGQLSMVKSQLLKATNTAQIQQEHIKSVDNVSVRWSGHGKNAFMAWKWIRENQSRFRYAVYGPILNEVQFKEKLHAQWFENVVARNVLVSFVTQCQEDYDLFLSEVREKLGIPVNCMLADVGVV